MAFSKAADTMSLIGKPSLLAMILIFFNNSEETMVQKRSSLFARSFSFCFDQRVSAACRLPALRVRTSCQTAAAASASVLRPLTQSDTCCRVVPV